MKPYDIVLVSCGKSKLDHAAPAGDLYTSTLFRLSKAWALRNGRAWGILSAAHGVLLPGTIIEPYDKTLHGVGRDGIRHWQTKVATGLRRAIDLHWRSSRSRMRPRVAVLAGEVYCKPLRENSFSWISNSGFDEPLKGLQIGERLQFLKASE